METMIYCWASTSSIVWNYTDLFAICINRTASDVSDQGLSVLEPAGLTHLFNFIRNSKYSDIWFLSPANKIVICNLNTTNFALTLREN